MFDLEAINAAIKLGDVPIPPPGVRIVLANEWIRAIVVARMSLGGSDDALVVRTYQAKPELEEWIGINWLRENPYSVVAIPDGSPPFKDWDRDY